MIRAIIRGGLVAVLTVWAGTGLFMYWILGTTERQYINMSVEAILIPARVARIIAVHGFGYNVSSDFLDGTSEYRAAEAEKDRLDAERAAAGCAGWNPHCRTAAEVIAKRKADEAQRAFEQKCYDIRMASVAASMRGILLDYDSDTCEPRNTHLP